MGEWKKFNLNENVRIKITKRGLECMERNHAELYRCWPSAKPEFKPPEVDEEGYTKMQLWCVMRELGQHLGNGIQVPMETEIFFETEEKKQ